MWNWVKKLLRLEPVVVEKMVLLPVRLEDSREWKDKWADREFLRGVQGFGRNALYLELVWHALSGLRAEADRAADCQELKGMQKGIEKLRWLLSAPTEARWVLESDKAMKELQHKAEGEAFG